MSGLSKVRLSLKHAQQQLHHPEIENHEEVRHGLLNAFCWLCHDADVALDMPFKTAVHQDFQLNAVWCMEEIEEVLGCLHHLPEKKQKRKARLEEAASLVREAYLLI